MINTYQEVDQQLKQELSALRQTIMRVAPGVMYDGRFDQMIISPITILDIARELLQELIPNR